MYRLGVDVGTSFTAAAVERDGIVASVPLGTRAHLVPTVVFRTEDGGMLVGEEAARRAPLSPARVARQFTRTVGDRVPVRLAGRPTGAHELVAEVAAWTVERASSLHGGPPQEIVLAVPATWGTQRSALVTDAVAARLGRDVSTAREPIAAAHHHAAVGRWAVGDVVAVYDLGGGTFDATVVRRRASGFEVVGPSFGDDGLGGLDLDRLLVDHVAHRVGSSWQQADPTDPAVARAVAQVRLAAADAKERLSLATETVVPVALPGQPPREVRITRAGFEELIHDRLERTVEVLRRAVAGAGLTGDRLASVLLVGGASRIPLVARLVGEGIGAPVVLAEHPKLAVCLGAVVAGAGTAEVRVTEPPPGAEDAVRFALPPMDDTSVVPPDAPPDAPLDPPLDGEAPLDADPSTRTTPAPVADTQGAADETDEIPRVVAPIRPAPPAQASTSAPPPAGTCSACGEVNDPGASFCRRCGAPLGGQPVAFAPAAADAVDAPGRSRRRGRRAGVRGARSRARGLTRILAIALAAVGGVGLVGATLAQTGLLDRADASRVDGPVLSASPAPPSPDRPDPVRLDPASVTATASSALEPIGDLRYDAAMVLDGDPLTAWNDGVTGAVGIGERLTFGFDAPFELLSMEIVNGYAKVDPSSGADRWEQNARVDELGVTTDGGAATVGLADTREPQTVETPTGTTCSVELTIESVHGGEDYLDVAISEVVFVGRPAPGTCSP